MEKDKELALEFAAYCFEMKGGNLEQLFLDFLAAKKEVKRDYEILSYIGKVSETVYNKTEDGRFTNDKFTYTLENIQDDVVHLDIYSVKRLSDGEVFTLGDTINFDNQGVGKLTKIEFEIAPADKGTGRLCFDNDCKNLGKWWEISKLSKAKQSLFKTVDGVEIYGGETIYAVSDGLQLLYGSYAKENDKSLRSFAKRENAEKYILMNKPLLSLDDLLSVWNIHRDDELHSTSPLFRSFEELARKKQFKNK
jgi:hypothetical protein